MTPGATAATGSAALPVDVDPQAVAILASLRLRDSRLILTGREVATLAPRVTAWLAQGTGAEDITAMLTTGLPERFMARPARILAFRLGDLPVAVPDEPAAEPTPSRPTVLPWQTCDGGCERAFRAAEPGVCRDCRPDGDTPTAGQVIARDMRLRTAC